MNGWQWRRPGGPPPSAAVWVSADGSTRVYTRKARLFLVLLVLFLAVILALGAGTEFFPVGSARTVFMCAVLALGASAAFRIHRMAIVVTPGRVSVRGFWGTRSLTASDIARFEPPPPYGALRRAGLRVVLTSGRVVSAGAFAPGKLDGASVGAVESSELNHWLSRHAVRN